jgi:ribose transport system substrate-binding protein
MEVDMKSKLKVISLIMALVMLVAMIGACGGDTNETTAAPADTTAAPAETTKAPDGEEPTETTAAPGETDWKSFKIDPAQIPQEKLDTTLYVGASIRGLDNPYIVTIIEGMKMFTEYLDSIGQKYEMQTLDSGGSNDKEVDNMKQFAAKAGGNAIAYSDPNEAAIAPALAEAMAESGGFIGTAWNKPLDISPLDYTPNWVIHTSPDNAKSGQAISEVLFEAMGGSGQILVLDGMLGNNAAIDRGAGLDAALAANSNIEIAARDTANWDTKQALNLVETWLNQYPDVKGIWCANDSMATGALQALDKVGLKGEIPVVGVDGTTDMINAINDGYATATVSSNGYLQGGYTLAICYAAWTGLIDPAELPDEYREFATPAMLVTSDNVGDFIAEYVDSVPEFDFSEIFYCKAD